VASLSDQFQINLGGHFETKALTPDYAGSAAACSDRDVTSPAQFSSKDKMQIEMA
jgi:hypothetical protein